MIRYVPSSKAEELSDALWRLTRPSYLRDDKDSTTKIFGWVDDLQAQRWIVVDTEYTIPVHAESELDGIADILRPWIEEGYLPPDTNATLAAFIESKRGQMLTVYDAFPQLFKDMSKTQQEMIDAGLLANPLLP